LEQGKIPYRRAGKCPCTLYERVEKEETILKLAHCLPTPLQLCYNTKVIKGTPP